MNHRLVEDIQRQQSLMKIEEQEFFDVYKFMGLNKPTPQDATSVDMDIPDLGSNLKGSFEQMASNVIDKFEGGYYHPNMTKDGRYPGGTSMGNSGETMMGIDRKHGGTINTSSDGREFWNIIDKAGAKEKWKWNYKGGPLESKLRGLVSKMIKPLYDDYVRRYLSPEAGKIVNESPSLMMHFIYAVWNGPGWFQKFSRVINDAVKKGITDPNKLSEIAVRSRIDSGNSIIAKTGRKMDDLIGTNLV